MNKLQILVAVLIVLVMGAYGSLFRVNEWEKALLLQFGEVQSSDFSPGLYFKIPMVQNVKKFDGRVLTFDAGAEPFLTVEKKNVMVDSFVKWRINNTALFYTSMGGDELSARNRVTTIVNRGLRDEFGKRTIQDAISGEREQIMSVILASAAEQLNNYGIGIVDVRIKRIDLPENVSDSVYDRMDSERKRVAKDFRSRGAEEAERIRAEADRQVEITKAEAYRDAEETRGQGDAAAAEIYAGAFQANAEFYSFYRSLIAYRETFSASGNNMIVIEPKSDFFKYFRDTESSKAQSP